MVDFIVAYRVALSLVIVVIVGLRMCAVSLVILIINLTNNDISKAQETERRRYCHL